MMLLKVRSSPLLSFALCGLLCTFSTVLASDECQPVTWLPGTRKRDMAQRAPDVGIHLASTIATSTAGIPTATPSKAPILPGQINCRRKYATSDAVNYYTCTELADEFGTSRDLFFLLNPALKPDCSNIQPYTNYCVIGFIEPLRAWDGLCGPPHNGATCAGTAAQCCNAETFTCGNSDADCEAGTCYEGACLGDSTYGTDGTCGFQHGNRLCAGKWGNCCNMDGKCGIGGAFCGAQVCQSGDCEWMPAFSSNSSSSSSSSSSKATSSTTGTTSSIKPTSSSTSSTVAAIPTLTDCVQGTGTGGYTGLCDFSCHYGFCPSPCTCTSHSATPVAPPALTGTRGYGVAGLPADFGPLCDFTCSHGYCPSDVCSTAPPATTPSPGNVCVSGAGTGGYTGLCDFCCHYGYCPPGPCTCTQYGPQVVPPPETNSPGKEAPGNDASYSGLCSYACNHGYCPAGACVFA
ncbi:hypothetical protein CONLIGDRAFT_637363 [Coniochaeta ligniaria NRRL 30616]|uniref:Chitin-binding type-1 domain-containing protein n=1 Tax=Coniochaeta ligniaria NRRL 30616 TaxID=1408157 RepID=A0A1J7I7K3_9PEZI|nr:hypothetical protein CONLIGDRAFT_637363 [Coniochaeta ligniaria NRRL 30616]